MADDSPEFLVAQAVDPYSNDTNQQAYLKSLCTRIAINTNERTIVIRLLTHRILSPDQNEVFSALNALDFVSTNSDLSIFEELNKLAALNAFIQLLSPEHQAQQTTAKNKDKAVSLLSTWKNASANVENISKVYSMLCSRKLIDPKTCSFDNLKSSNKLNESSTNHRVNNVETQKNNSTEVVEMVRLKAQILNDLFDTVDLANQLKDEKLLQELYSELINVRPTLFHFTVEASEKQEQEMVEILALNDHLNSIINRYKLNERPPHPNSGNQTVSVRFDPESTKMDRISNVYRKPTPHSKAAGLLTDTDYSKLLAASNSKTLDKKRLSDSSINEEMENLELSNSSVPES